jgi:hypothetical protein
MIIKTSLCYAALSGADEALLMLLSFYSSFATCLRVIIKNKKDASWGGLLSFTNYASVVCKMG